VGRPETYFLGEVHGGDFYNRYPVECRLVGTRRWAPGNTLRRSEAEFRALLAPIAAESGCAIELDLQLVRGPYEIDPEHRLAVALRERLREVTGQELPLTGVKLVADGAMFNERGIPTVYHGPMGTGAHGDVESIEVAELVRATQVYLALLERSGPELRAAVRGLPLASAGDVNLGVDVCERHPRDAVAIVVTDGREVTDASPSASSRTTRTASPTRCGRAGSGEGDRVGIALPQRPETAVAHVAVYKLGAIAVPLSTRFGPDAMAVRLGTRIRRSWLADRELDGVLTIDVDRELPALLAAASDRFEPAATAADAPALIVYTSGTTGPPKGALLAHRVLYGHLPGFELSHDFFPQPGRPDLVASRTGPGWAASSTC
jgi:hypothetical protein